MPIRQSIFRYTNKRATVYFMYLEIHITRFVITESSYRISTANKGHIVWPTKIFYLACVVIEVAEVSVGLVMLC